MSGRTYSAPTVTQYGPVGEVTLSHTVLFGTKLAAAFVASVVNTTPSGQGTTGNGGITNSAPFSPGATGPAGTVSSHVPALSQHLPSGSGGSLPAGANGGSNPSGASHHAAASGGGHGQLPFTGMALALTAGVGLTLAGAGERLRRLTRRTADDR